jgi:hypothetical protein
MNFYQGLAQVLVLAAQLVHKHRATLPGSVGLKLEYPLHQARYVLPHLPLTNFMYQKMVILCYNIPMVIVIPRAIASFVPVMVGARIYSGKLFFEGDVGASFNLNSAKAYTAKTVAPILSPSIGYGFRFGSEQKIGLDLSLSYETRLESSKEPSDYSLVSPYINKYGSYNMVAFHVAFSLGL